MKNQNFFSLLVLIFTTCSSLLADTKIIAISYFDNTSGLEQYNPLSKGLADMLITDLSNVKSIQIVEREKLESLLEEIDLGEGKFIDPNTAQNLGKGLGAGYMLTGSFLIMGETMRIDARLVDVGTGKISMADEITGSKENFFELEKSLVNKLVATLNLDLSISEERRIKKVQTESFEAFNAYSSAIDALDNEDYEESKKLLEKAVEIDDDYDIAWDKLDEIVENLEKLLKMKEMRLSNDVISIIDALENNDKASCEIFHKMFFRKEDNLRQASAYINANFYSLAPTHPAKFLQSGILIQALRFGQIDYDPNIKNFISNLKKQPSKFGLTQNDNSREKIISNYSSSINSLDEYILHIKTVFEELIYILKYIDSKNFELNICADIGGMVENWYIQNPVQLIGTWFITRDWMPYEGTMMAFLRLEYLSDSNIEVKAFDGEIKNIKTALDELIIYFGNKYLESFPYDVTKGKLGVIDQAIKRKQTPEIYNAYKWLIKYGSLNANHLWSDDGMAFGAWDAESNAEVWRLIIYDYDRNEPIPSSLSQIPYLSEYRFMNCITKTDLKNIRTLFPNDHFTTINKEQYLCEDCVLGEDMYNYFTMVKMRIKDQIKFEGSKQ
jgi:TolB-like protein